MVKILVFPLIFILLGCGGSKLESSSKSSVNNRKIITILQGQSTSDPGVEEIINDLVKEKIPNVDMYWESMGWGDLFKNHISLRFSSGEIPDIIICKALDINEYAPLGYLSKLDDELTSNIKPNLLSSVSYNNSVYGIPLNVFYQGVLYNKDVFEKIGAKIPNTIEELKTLSILLVEKGYTPFATHFEDDWFLANIFMQIAIGELDINRDIFLDEDGFKYAVDSIKFISDNSWDNKFHIKLNEADEKFSNSEAVMYLTGTWSLQNIGTINPNMNLGIFPFPNRRGDSSLIIEPNMTITKSASSKNSDIVDSIIREIVTDPKLVQDILDYTKTQSAIITSEVEYPELVQDDIKKYIDSDLTIDATKGNNRFLWKYQEEFADVILSWLKGEISQQELSNYYFNNYFPGY